MLNCIEKKNKKWVAIKRPKNEEPLTENESIKSWFKKMFFFSFLIHENVYAHIHPCSMKEEKSFYVRFPWHQSEIQKLVQSLLFQYF